MRIKWQGQNVNLAGSSVPCSPTLVPSASLTTGFCRFWWQTRRDSCAQWLLRCTLFYCESVVQYDEQAVNQKLGEWINKLKLWWSLPHNPEGIMKTPPLHLSYLPNCALTTGPTSETPFPRPLSPVIPRVSTLCLWHTVLCVLYEVVVAITEDTPSISRLQSHWTITTIMINCH